jgi:hypothetical protein
MRKALIVALALMSLEAYFVAIAKAAENRCEAILINCNNRCAAGPDTKHNCFSLCAEENDLCENFLSGGKNDNRTVSSGTNAGANAGTAATTIGTSGSASTPTKPVSPPSLGGGSPTSVSGGSGLTNRKLQ